MTDYDVGYRKPPKQSKFKKGETGNPRGRPKRTTHAMPEWREARMKAIIRQEAYRLIDIKRKRQEDKAASDTGDYSQAGCVRRAGATSCDALLYGDAEIP